MWELYHGFLDHLIAFREKRIFAFDRAVATYYNSLGPYSSMTFIEHNPGGTWRGSPFAAGGRYRVLRAAPSYQGELIPGEVLTYYGASYSHYDNLSVYVFTNAEGSERTWELLDEAPLEKWSEIFAVVPNAG